MNSQCSLIKMYKELNFNQQKFPVLFEENISNFKLIESLGEIKEGLFFKLEITNPSKNIYLIQGRIVSTIKSQCQSCLLDTDIIINIDPMTSIKDSELQQDNDNNYTDVHYQKLDKFDIYKFIAEEIFLNFPSIVFCSKKSCVTNKKKSEKKTIRPFKKIRDLLD